MSMVNISLASFERVKRALTSFKFNISGYSSKISSAVKSAISDCQTKLQKQIKKVDDLNRDIKSTEAELNKNRKEEREKKEEINKLLLDL